MAAVPVLWALLSCAVLAAGFIPPHLPPLHPHPVFAPPRPPQAEPPPQKHFPGSVCPAEATCVRPQDCSRQCRPGWDSYGLSSCFLLGPSTGASQTAAQEDCSSRDGHLPVLEEPEELSRLAEFGVQWTDASWDGDRAVWVWAATGQEVDFAALGTAAPPDGSTAAACLVVSPGVPAGSPPVFTPTDCAQTTLYSCETGSSSVARCARHKERLCCAVSASHFPEPCYVDEQGTRCEQRIREGYFPLGDGLIRPSEAEPLSWSEARALCQQEGGELLTVDDSQMNQAVLGVLSGLESLGAVEFYIGLSSNAAGEFSYVNGTPAVPGSAYLNFATAEDASRPNSCAFYSGLAWSSGDCTAPRDYVCHIRRVRHSLVQEPQLPVCGVRRRQGVLGKTGRGLFPPVHLPPIGHPPPLAGTGDRDAAQFGEITWQAAVWTRSSPSDHQFSCSGALVHPAWVLTSAGCVAGTEPEDLKVTVGDWDLQESQPVILQPVALDVTRVRTSPGRVSHGPYGPVIEAGRLAMLRITPELDGDEYPHIGPVCLPDATFLQRIHQLRCVVTGWRGGSQPVHQPWRPQPRPEPRDILRKFETGARHDPECQDVAHHLKQLTQRPPFLPPFPGQPYPPPYPVPYSAAGPAGLEARSQFGFFGPSPLFGPPPPAADQPALYVCPREPRCIPDGGALLACALPPPPPPPPFRPGPPHSPLPFYRSAQNDTAQSAAAPAQTAAPAPASPADAYEQLARGFRPPVDKNTAEKRTRRGADDEGAASATAADSGSASETPTPETPAPDAPDSTPSSRGSNPDSSGRSKLYNLPHKSILGAFHRVPPPVVVQHHHHHIPEPELEPQTLPGAQQTAATRYYDAYVLVGVASALTDGCALGQMIFDDVVQEAEFVQQVLHRDG